MFYELRFPLELNYGSSGGPGQTILLNENQEGNIISPIEVQTSAIREYSIRASAISSSEFHQIRDFFLLVKKGGFRFKDPGDYQGTNELIGIGDGTTTDFQLVKNYNSTPVQYAIRKVDTGAGKFTIEDADLSLFSSGALFFISGSTGNDANYQSSGVVTETYTIEAATEDTKTVEIDGDVSGEFSVNQLISINLETTRIYSISYNEISGNTEIVLKTWIACDAADLIYGNTTITVTSTIASAVADGYVNGYKTKSILKPVVSTGVTITVDGSSVTEGVDFDVDYKTGLIVFAAGSVPDSGEEILATFEYDIPCVFRTKTLSTDFENYEWFSFSLDLVEWPNPS